MILVIFELEPSGASGKDRYFELAAGLRDTLARIDGFISIERFESLTTPGRYLSLSAWRDEAAVSEWRNHANHREAQMEGRAGVLRGYRLRVAHVVRDYGLDDRTGTPADSEAVHARSET